MTTTERIRQIVAEHAQLAVAVDTLADDSDLFEAGMTSHASVSLLLAIEDAFEVQFPDRMLHRAIFATIGSLTSAVEELITPAARASG